MLKVAAVAVWEALTMNLSILITLSWLEPVAAQGHSPLIIAGFVTVATVVQAFLAFFPNSWLMRSSAHNSAGACDTSQRMGMAALFSLLAPLVAAAIALGLGLSISR